MVFVYTNNEIRSKFEWITSKQTDQKPDSHMKNIIMYAKSNYFSLIHRQSHEILMFVLSPLFTRLYVVHTSK